MKKRLAVLISLCLLTISAALLTGCSDPPMEAPVFVKELISAEDMDVDIRYISDKSWDKKVKSVNLPHMPEGMEAVVYDEENEPMDGYQLHTIHLGINSNHLNEDSGLAEPFEFSQIKIIWDDDSEVTADIGHIKISSIKESEVMSHLGSEQLDTEEATETFEAAEGIKIVGLNIPYQEEFARIVSDLSINGAPVDTIKKESPIQLAEGETCEITYSQNRDAQSEYGKVFIEGELLSIDKQGKQHSTIIRFNLYRETGSSIKEYLK